MNWFGKSKMSGKKILLTNFVGSSKILDVEECQIGIIVRRTNDNDSYLILEAGGSVYHDKTHRWYPYSGFSQESLIQEMTFRKKPNEQPR